MSFFLSLSSSLFPLLLSPRRQFILLTYPSVLLHHQRGKDEASHRRTGDSRQPVSGQRDGLLVADVRRSHQRAWIRPRPRTGQSGQRVHPDGFNHFPSPSSFYNLCINVSPPPLANHLLKTTQFISLFFLIPSCPVPPFLLMPLLFILSIDIIFVFIFTAPSWAPRPVFLDHFWSEFPLLLSFAHLLYLFLSSYWASCSSIFFSYFSSFF